MHSPPPLVQYERIPHISGKIYLLPFDLHSISEARAGEPSHPTVVTLLRVFCPRQRCSNARCNHSFAYCTTRLRPGGSFSNKGNNFTIFSFGVVPKWKKSGVNPVLWCTVMFMQSWTNGISLAHLVWLSAQYERKIRPSSRIVLSTELLCGCLLDENNAVTPIASSLLRHVGEVNCVPWSDNTSSGFPIFSK